MKPKVLVFGLLFLIFSSAGFLQAQNSIHFADITIKAATQRANIENKNIFVDTYAPWCGPCKIMDIHFQDKEVINYFNRHFINVKIDTDTPYGKKVSAKYQIAFLPTILILDKDGATRFKVDKLINRDELLSLAKYAIDGPSSPKPISPPPPKKEIVEVKPKTQKTKQKKIKVIEPAPENEEPGEKILYVLDGTATNLPPEILYEEAYFRLQLNDGSHKEAAQKYLATQEDWNTEKNLKFIFDFLYDTDSKEFEYFIANKESFEGFIAKDKIQRSLKILVEYKLYQGIPRPDFERSRHLLSLIDKENSEKNNYHYFLNRLHSEGKMNKFNQLCDDYFKLYEDPHQDICVNYISEQLNSKQNKSKLKSFVGMLDMIENKNENYSLYLLYSKLYHSLSDKEKAMDSANMAIEIGKNSKLDIQEAQQILASIKEL